MKIDPYRLCRRLRTESSIQALQAETQDNKQILSTTQVGSTLRFQPRRRQDTLLLEYAYVDLDADDTQTDSVRNTGSMSYVIESSPMTSLQMQASHRSISFEGPFPSANFTLATFGYAIKADSFDLDVKIGHNWYDRAGRGSSDDSTYDA